jgi:hypothetical protein
MSIPGVPMKAFLDSGKSSTCNVCGVEVALARWQEGFGRGHEFDGYGQLVAHGGKEGRGGCLRCRHWAERFGRGVGASGFMERRWFDLDRVERMGY